MKSPKGKHQHRMSLLPGYSVLCISLRRSSSAQIHRIKKFLLSHSHLLLILLLLYYQHHILQWQKIGKVCQRSHLYFDPLHWGYSLLGSEDRNRKFHAQFMPLSDVTYGEQGRISQLTSHCESKRYYCIKQM